MADSSINELQGRVIDIVDSTWELREKLPPWIKGNVCPPELIKECSLEWDLMKKYAVLGAGIALTRYNVRLYFLQSAVFGIVCVYVRPELWEEYGGTANKPPIDEVAMVTVSQFGKSFVSALCALELAFEGETVNVGAGRLDGTETIFKHIRSILQNASLEVTSKITDYSYDKLDKLNSAASKRNISFPHTNGSIRAMSLGAGYDDKSKNNAVGADGCWIIDESGLIDDASYNETGRRFVASSGKKSFGLQLSNPHYTDNHFQKTMLNPQPNVCIVWTDLRNAIAEGRYTDKSAIYANPWFDDPDIIEKYWLCEFGDGLRSFFDREIPDAPDIFVERATDIYVAGLDSAYTGADSTKLCIGRYTETADGSNVVIEAVYDLKPKGKWVHGVTGYEIVSRIGKLLDLYNVQLVMCDLGSAGQIVEELTRISMNKSWNVLSLWYQGQPDKTLKEAKYLPAVSASNNRAMLHLILKDALESNTLYISPKLNKIKSELKEEMRSIEGKLTASGKTQIADKKVVKAVLGRSPDTLDSLTLMLCALIYEII